MSASVTEPIAPTWKISRVIQQYPALLDVIVGSAPAFQRLRNPVVRRVQSRLVTVEQAAAIAGIAPDAFVERLNAAAGLSAPEGGREETEPRAAEAPPPWVNTATVAQELDVRPFQQTGQEPFAAIMAATRRVPRGQVLVLRNTFEPVPLYTVLGQRGFERWTRRLGGDDWEIRFFHSGVAHDAPPTEPAAPVATRPAEWDAPAQTLTIDVSELVPPEPMIRILTALEELPPGATLLVHHVRRPMHLYPRLDELGYRHETRELGPNRVEVLIEKAGSPAGDAS